MTTTIDRNGNQIRYGIINKDLVLRWVKLPPEDDGPFWAINLMKYRDVADYGDDASANKTGREADDEYTPRDSLAGVGAKIVFAADVERTLVGDSVDWDRIGIVRYPSRKAFFEMQQRDDFKKSHVHKDAGMEFTIVMSCLPVLPFTGAPNRHPYLELTVTAKADLNPRNEGNQYPRSLSSAAVSSSVESGEGDTERGDRDNSAAVAEEEAVGIFDVEGVIVGDNRIWTHATFRWLPEPPPQTPKTDDDSTYRLLLRPSIDHLTTSVLEL